VGSFKLLSLFPKERALVHITQEPEWAAGQICTIWKREHSWPCQDSNFDSSVVQPATRRYIDCPMFLYTKQCFNIGLVFCHVSMQIIIPKAEDG
jgi:hypothetical protein